MGNWQLEVFKMSIYMAFPVALFYAFNQPQLFEEWVVKKKRECFPPADPVADQQLKDFINTFKAKKREELEKELAAVSDSTPSGH
ncbi:protein PET100 homolog, mitochondrial [Dermacentor variabilis]|uniref:protein PET100 homolog, mitochondrial n=1 Tax=Dermacentor variabilis TaxID=34621 RepID=UPI003F5BD61A